MFVCDLVLRGDRGVGRVSRAECKQVTELGGGKDSRHVGKWRIVLELEWQEGLRAMEASGLC